MIRSSYIKIERDVGMVQMMYLLCSNDNEATREFMIQCHVRATLRIGLRKLGLVCNSLNKNNQ